MGFFDYLLDKANVVGTPGSGFGPSGEGYFRLTAFGTYESTVAAIERLRRCIKNGRYSYAEKSTGIPVFYRYVFGICVPQMASQQMQRDAVRILDILLSVVL